MEHLSDLTQQDHIIKDRKEIDVHLNKLMEMMHMCSEALMKTKWR